MREAYRLNKHDLTAVLADTDLSLRVAFVYVGKEELDYFAIEKGMKKALLRLCDEANPAESRP
jgi:ribonuclease P protein component